MEKDYIITVIDLLAIALKMAGVLAEMKLQ